MGPLEELIDWATSHGVKLNGILPERILGRGIGVLATRDIEVDEIILDVPTNCLRTLSTVPKARVRKLTEVGGISVHGILAADIVLEKAKSSTSSSSSNSKYKYGPWDAVIPQPEDLVGMPLTWPSALQALLPPHATELLTAQKAKFTKDKEYATAAFPNNFSIIAGDDDGDEDGYRHAWLLVNSRTFYYLNAALRRHHGATKDDHMTLQPVADLFNHGDEAGCHVAYGSDGYSFRATRAHASGEEVKICYGTHGGDALLVEYGFVMADDENCWDEVMLDDVVLPRLDDAQRERLTNAGFLGRYVLDREGVCHRTQVALRLLCCGKGVGSIGEWMRFVEGKDGGDDEERTRRFVDELLLELLRESVTIVDGLLKRVRQLEREGVGKNAQRDLLTERWMQIRWLLNKRLKSLEQIVK